MQEKNTNSLYLQINNQLYFFDKNLTIFQACLEKKFFLPRFCYHVALQIAGNCRMCLIEEKSSIKPLASCAVSISHGMHIFTNTEIVKKAREGVLEYLLINHPLDCPICDQGGECDLQDQSLVFGSDRGRFYEEKRSVVNKNLGYLIKTFLNRCIHCARCTRFLNELAGTNELSLLGRGHKTEISNYTSALISSEISGNIIDLCPVGALTSKPYAFKARSWELIPVYTYDIMDAFASSIQLDFRGYELMRILPKTNKYLNDEWISDKTRFYYDSIKLQRLTKIVLLHKQNLQHLTWDQALILIKNYLLNLLILLHFFNKTNYSLHNNYGEFLDLETAFSIKKIFSILTKTNNKWKNKKNFDSRSYYRINPLKNLFNENSKKNFFFFFTNPRFESAILNLKIKKYWNEKKNKIFLIGFYSDFNYSVNHLDLKLTKKNLNFIKTFKEKTNFLGEKKILSFPKSFNNNNLFTSITNLTLAESNIEKKKINIHDFVHLTFNFDQPENSSFFDQSPLTVNFLHHMDNNFIFSLIVTNKTNIFFPTRFYYEKISNYLGNTLNFFKTHHHFSFNLKISKEDWFTIFAISEKSGLTKFMNKDKAYNFLTNQIKKLKDNNKIFLFKNLENNFYFFNKTHSKVNVSNFFDTNLMSRISQTLSLCSKNLENNFKEEFKHIIKS